MKNTDYQFGFSFNQRQMFFHNKLIGLVPKCINTVIYVENIKEIQQLLCQFDNDEIKKIEAINAYMILGSLVESVIDIYFIYSKTEDEIMNIFDRKKPVSIPHLSLEQKLDKFSEIFEGRLTDEMKDGLTRIREKRNYIHFINRDFNDWSVSDFALVGHNNPYYFELCLDVLAYDMLSIEIINVLTRQHGKV